VSTGDVAEVVTLVAAGLSGLLVGSFLNVVVYRVPRHLSIVRPPSHCTVCDARLTALDMIPVLSWLVLRARCRHCRAPVSARYPLVELSTAIAFLAVAGALRSHWLVPSVAVVTACTLAAALVDADGAPVPPAAAVLIALGAASLVPIEAVLGNPSAAGWAALGAALAGGASLGIDRSGGPARWVRITVLASLGWTAGALWAGGGPFVAAWLVVATVATVVGSTRRAPLPVLLAGSFAAVVASAVLARL
jgi:prepilin signal peptidase PulO-like enzyme (type II secretory pathway)